MSKIICILYTETNGLHNTNDDVSKKNMYQFAGRVVFRKDGLSDQSQNGLIRFPRAWFVFEKGYTGKPTIDWILPELDINPSRASFPILSW